MNTKRTPLIERFNARFQRGTPVECWIWNGVPNSCGYGTIREPGRNGRTLTAHKLSYQHHIGPVPSGMCVCHTCDVRLCVNPDHLFLGTNADNIADRDRKGRCKSAGKPGEACGHAKLTNKQALAIITDARPHQIIADSYGVSRTTISRVKSGKTFSFLRTLGKWEEAQ